MRKFFVGVFVMACLASFAQGVEYTSHARVVLARKTNSKLVFAEKVSVQVDGYYYSAHIDRVEERGENNYSLFGKIGASPFLSSFTKFGDAVAGDIQLPNGEHWMLTTRGGRQYMLKMDHEKISRGLVNDQIWLNLPAKAEAMNVPAARLIRHRLPSLVCPKGQTLVWEKPVLYLYDSTALEWAEGDKNGVITLARLFADGTTVIHTNSLIPNYRIKMVGIEEFEGHRSNGNLIDDIMAMINSPRVTELKEKTGAVQVVLITGISDGRFYGISTGNAFDQAKLVYNVIAVLGGTVAAAHEDGHADGAMHQPGSGSQAVVPYGYAWLRNGVGMDLMANWSPAACTLGCPYIPVLSNPHVFVNGGMIGLTGEPAGTPGVCEAYQMPALAYPAFGVNPTCQ